MYKLKHYRILCGYFDKFLNDSKQVPRVNVRRPTKATTTTSPTTMANPPLTMASESYHWKNPSIQAEGISYGCIIRGSR